jgi:hypothetical protein
LVTYLLFCEIYANLPRRVTQFTHEPRGHAYIYYGT